MQKVNDQDKRIKELEQANLKLKAELQALPYGRSPQQIRNDFDAHQQQKKENIRLLTELKNTGTFSFIKKRRIIKALMEYI